MLTVQSSPKDYREKILLLANNQPVQPTQIAKALNTNSILASAMLSEMVAQGKLLVSHLKFGSSPLYYIPQKEEQLLSYAHTLNEKDQQTLTLLKEKKVLRDSSLEPLPRVSLRNIKDFAKLLTVKYGDSQELFWKFYLTPDPEAEQLIKDILKPAESLPEPKHQPEKKETTQEPVAVHQPRTQNLSQKQPQNETQQHIPLQSKKIQKQKTTKKTSSLAESITDFFSSNNIGILDELPTKKSTEQEYSITIPTPIGNVPFYCYATNKKRINDTDLSNAYVKGQLKKLPILYIHQGTLTPKAKDILKDLTGLTLLTL